MSRRGVDSDDAVARRQVRKTARQALALADLIIWTARVGGFTGDALVMATGIIDARIEAFSCGRGKARPRLINIRRLMWGMTMDMERERLAKAKKRGSRRGVAS